MSTGVIRDKMGNYNYVIVAVNVMTALCIIMWTTEFIIVAIRKRRRAQAAQGAADIEKVAKQASTQ